MVPGLGRVLQSPDGASLFSTTYTLDGITYYTVSLQSPDGASLFSTRKAGIGIKVMGDIGCNPLMGLLCFQHEEEDQGHCRHSALQSPDGASLFSTRRCRCRRSKACDVAIP